jgi:hypothetical protein
MQNCRVKQTDARIDYLNLYIRYATCQPLPFLSYREKGERRPSSGTRAGVGDSPGNTRALFRSTRGKELGLWPGTRVFVGRPGFVTVPIYYLLLRFHTPGRRPARARFFFIIRVFEAWALGLGTWIGRDSGLGTR